MSFVSKRFHDLCLAPSLISEVALTLQNQANPNAALSSLQNWQAVNAQHVTSFSLVVDKSVDFGLVHGCLATFCTAAPLEKLAIDLSTGQPLHSVAFLASVRSTLKDLTLRLVRTVPLTIDTALQRCTALTSLLFGCKDLEFDGSRLPSSLTRMELRLLRQGLPSQVHYRILLLQNLLLSFIWNALNSICVQCCADSRTASTGQPGVVGL